MAKILQLTMPDGIHSALTDEGRRNGRTVEEQTLVLLAEALEAPLHTLFQVSTSGALVSGVFDRQVGVRSILERGDFGLGTFEKLDGEMVVLDGRAYQVRGTGAVEEASPDQGVPFAVVTRFEPGLPSLLSDVTSLADLGYRCDGLRGSDNVFSAIRIDGEFRRVCARAVKPARDGGLADAARSQGEFAFEHVRGSLVGIWSPGFSSAFSVKGYHFHFLSEDRRQGGHVLELESPRLAVMVQRIDQFHLSLPETAEFLRADLSRDRSDELAQAEGSKR